MWAIHGSQRNAYGGPTREQYYCCTHILPCEHKLKHEEHRKDRKQNSPSSTSYYEAVIPVHTQWHGGTGMSGAWTMPESQWQCPEYLR